MNQTHHRGSPRAQNRHFCALLAFGTPIFGHSEHKIGFFVSEWAIFPRFLVVLTQKWGFCAREEWKMASGSVKVIFLQFTKAKRQPHPALNTCTPARQQPYSAEIRRWRKQSVQMGRKICVCLSSNSMWQRWKMRTNIVRCSIGRIPMLRVSKSGPDAPDC